MDMAIKPGLMETITLVIGRMIKEMVMVHLLGKMAISTLVIGRMIRQMVMV